MPVECPLCSDDFFAALYFDLLQMAYLHVKVSGINVPDIALGSSYTYTWYTEPITQS